MSRPTIDFAILCSSSPGILAADLYPQSKQCQISVQDDLTCEDSNPRADKHPRAKRDSGLAAHSTEDQQDDGEEATEEERGEGTDNQGTEPQPSKEQSE